MKSFLSLRSVEEVLELIEAFPVLPAETVPLARALGRSLACDLTSASDVPGFDRSTVDGYAVRARDVFGAQESSPALLEYIGDCPMGAKPDFVLGEGQAARIYTGGMLPEGADSVVMVEYSRPAGGSLIEIIRSLAPGDHVLMHNEDVAEGKVVLEKGRILGPQEIGLLAALGEMEVVVHRSPHVAIISTGDEVVPSDQTPGPGKVRDVNSHTLAALVRQAGGKVIGQKLVGDDRERLKQCVHLGLDEADVLLVSGGSSAGMRDYTIEIFQSMPESEILVHGVAISPGKPFILARSGAKCLMGLPGHVTGALICARVFLLPLLRTLQGVQKKVEVSLSVRLARALASSQGRRDYIRVRLEKSGEEWLAHPILAPSGCISSLVQADALVICPENREGLREGECVPALLLR